MLKQHQVGILFGLFVHAIGAARFVWTIAPLIVLLGLALVPYPRAKATIDPASLDAATTSSGFAQMLAVAQRTAAPFPYRASELDRPSRVARAAEVQQPVVMRRIGDRWLQARAEHSSIQPVHETDSPLRAIVERLLRSHDATLAAQAVPSVDLTEAIIALRNETMVGIPQPLSTGATARIFGRNLADMSGAAGATRNALAHDAVVAGTPPKRVEVATNDVAQAVPHVERAVSPLKLSHEQRKVSDFIARRYRVGVDDVQRFVAHAYRAAKDFRLDPHLVLAVMSIESSFNPNARSSAGAQGLMQVLTRVHLEKFEPFGGARAAFDPMANINVGSRILKDYLVREGTVEGALKSYVGAALLSHDYGYGNKVLRERARIAAVAEGRPIPEAPTRRVVHVMPAPAPAAAPAAPPAASAAPAPRAALQTTDPVGPDRYAEDATAQATGELRSL